MERGEVKAKQWRPRFSLRTFLLVVLLVCASAPYWTRIGRWALRRIMLEPMMPGTFGRSFGEWYVWRDRAWPLSVNPEIRKDQERKMKEQVWEAQFHPSDWSGESGLWEEFQRQWDQEEKAGLR